jgi:IS30 family transposase
MRRSRHHTRKRADHGRITDTVSIRERPAAVEERAVPGHWEGDLLFGSHNSQIATLLERHTRYVLLAKVDTKETKTVINALIRHGDTARLPLHHMRNWLSERA